MSKTKEANIILALKAIQNNPKLSARHASEIYKVPRTTLRNRMAGRPARQDTHANNKRLTKIEEEVIVQYVLDWDSRGYSLVLADVEDMANSLLRDRGSGAVGKHWAQRFVASESRLKTRVNRIYDYQRALCEDPDVINAWFNLVSNTRKKYGILDCDTYNFDEIGFMMGISSPKIVITHSD